ncbi:CDP-diacylglycerol--inositol 3-phosphatidyltransferase [Thrips palmi]|uniref:CDP-diacylglycerol--inositol 3-phosphatidyltransferase n=1 Tax=Thrips palmi TaxID=161013 RepID=A0A6P8YLL2_THRPL|nr:CDP-diacylglycerol--inositol 3-phosphatidyltransferase [Thrips palmi]XP_034237702.1 CDP-diacylglycerol--inositol 3-phosphatidyltransferase [Thrips palmi]
MEAQDNIFLFVPNLIGYARIVLALVAFVFMTTNYIIATWCYVLSAFLDVFDGYFARKLNQGTKFGAMLDQLTDRCGTTGLLVTLAYLYPSYMFFFQVSIAIDISCHWIYLHSSTLQGKTSHKFIDMSENPIMHRYYSDRKVLFFMCAGNEGFFASLYLLYFTEGPLLFGISILKVICLLSFPVMLVKTGISLLHGFVASLNLATIDLKEREEAKAKSQ